MLFWGAPTITSSWRLSPGARQAADGHATNENRLRPSSSFDPEFLRKAARLAREREILECPSEQNWRDTRNDHFRSALRTGRRSFFGWQFLASHVISFRPRLFGARPIDEGGPVGSGPRCESGGKPPFGRARLKVRTFSRPGAMALTMRRTTVNLTHDAGAPRGKRRDVAGLRPTAPVARTGGSEAG